MATVAMMARPQRWDAPFSPDMTDADIEDVLRQPAFSEIDSDKFPEHTPLTEILRNDTRIVPYQAGDIIVRSGDYGNSAFLVLDGKVRVVIAPELPRDMLGRQSVHKKGFLEALGQLVTNRRVPEVRDVRRYDRTVLRSGRDQASSVVFLQDIPAVLDRRETALLKGGELFGGLAALGRVPRTATVFAETDARLLEIRWQGLRDIRRYGESFRRRVDERYRENALKVALRETPEFGELDEAALQEVSVNVLFETHGTFDWHISYQKLRGAGQEAHEPVIARQGDYPDGVLMVRAGFARVSVKLGNGERTLTYLGVGDSFAMSELYDSWAQGAVQPLRASLTAIGYVDLIRVPAPILEKYVFPTIALRPRAPVEAAATRTLADDALLEWAVSERFINGTQAMLIDLDRCVRCDDCVRACAATHGGNPRFVRHGRTFEHWMVANACMHCADPVCMIGCPTGAIHRSEQGGMVVINDDTCIGCGTCANSCPYNNIRLVEIRDESGNILLDRDTQRPINKATKCDLCISNPGGPACVRACPHDALRRVGFHDDAVFRGSAP